MVQLRDLARGQSDLVAVGGVAGGRGGHDLALRQLAGDGLAHGDSRVGRAGDAHCLVDVGAPGERVADGTAHAGGGAAEGLDFGGVVVGLVLEEEQPVLVLAVDVDGHLDGAGVDLLGLVEVGEDALRFKPLGADGAHVHEADGLLVAAKLMAHLHVAVERGLDGGVVDLDVLEVGAKGGMTAVVTPVRIDDADLGDGGVAILALEVLLAEGDVRLVHGQAAIGDERREGGLVHLAEAVDDLDRLGIGNLLSEGVRELERGDARLDGVHHVTLDGVEVLGGELAGEHVHLGAAHGGALALGDELDALGGGGGALVELAGQRLDGEEVSSIGGQLLVHGVDLRLGEYGGHAACEQLLVDTLDVITVNDAQSRERLDAQGVAELGEQLLRLDVKPGFLLYVHARDH